jgi:hypothetical protein
MLGELLLSHILKMLNDLVSCQSPKIAARRVVRTSALTAKPFLAIVFRSLFLGPTSQRVASPFPFSIVPVPRRSMPSLPRANCRVIPAELLFNCAHYDVRHV